MTINLLQATNVEFFDYAFNAKARDVESNEISDNLRKE